MERKHALLSASGSSIWLNCPPSVRYGEKFEKKESDYAEEGTLAHDYVTAVINWKVGRTKKVDYQKEVSRIKKHRLYLPEMDRFVMGFVDYVLGIYYGYIKQHGWADLHVEIEVDYSHIAPEGFGHLDISILSPGRIDIIDFKYGKGIQVKALCNSQLGLYGIGALKMFQFVDEFTEMHLHIYQPRIDNISVDKNTVEEVTRWAEGTVKRQAALAFEGKGEFKAGKHCQFCPAAISCRVRAEHNLQLAKYEFKHPEDLSNEEIAEIFLQSEQFINWINSVRDFATDQAAKKNVNFPGLKLVKGRSNRKFLDEEAVIRIMAKAGFKTEDYRKFAALSVPTIESLLGLKFNKLLGKHVIKPEGAPTLVPMSDDRSGMRGADGAKADFKDLKTPIKNGRINKSKNRSGKV